MKAFKTHPYKDKLKKEKKSSPPLYQRSWSGPAGPAPKPGHAPHFATPPAWPRPTPGSAGPASGPAPTPGPAHRGGAWEEAENNMADGEEP